MSRTDPNNLQRAAMTIRERREKRFHGVINLSSNRCFKDSAGNLRPFSDIYEYDPARVENHQAVNAHLRRVVKSSVDKEAFIAIEWVIYLLIILALLTPYFLTALKERFFAKCLRRRKKAKREKKLRLEELDRRKRDYTRTIIPLRIPQKRRVFLKKAKVDPLELKLEVPAMLGEDQEDEGDEAIKESGFDWISDYDPTADEENQELGEHNEGAEGLQVAGLPESDKQQPPAVAKQPFMRPILKLPRLGWGQKSTVNAQVQTEAQATAENQVTVGLQASLQSPETNALQPQRGPNQLPNQAGRNLPAPGTGARGRGGPNFRMINQQRGGIGPNVGGHGTDEHGPGDHSATPAAAPGRGVPFLGRGRGKGVPLPLGRGRGQGFGRGNIGEPP